LSGDSETQSSKPIKKSRNQNHSSYDLVLLFSVLALVGIGLVMVYSASAALAQKKYGSDFYFLEKQALAAGLGFLALVFFKHFPLRWVRLMAYPMLLTTVACLIATRFTSLGFSAGGAQRWIRAFGFSFQPSEMARFVMMLYMAYSMSKKREMIKDFSVGFLPHVLILMILSALILIQPDFGSVLILGALTWIMMFIGGVRLTHLLSPLIVLIPAMTWLIIQEPYRVRRLISFLNPWQYASDEGYQIVHSLMAFGAGGIFGSGLGKGVQKLFYLPEPHTDFIFSVIGEELGCVGVIGILVLFFLILWRGVRIARKAPDAFSAFAAAGITAAIGLQAAINIGVTMGLLPTKGLTLPFLSYGGSSLLINMAAIGLLLNIQSIRVKSWQK